jgi:hypothetical protein
VPAIRDLTRDILGELDKTILDSFTTEELQIIDVSVQLSFLFTPNPRMARTGRLFDLIAVQSAISPILASLQ